MSGKFRQRVAFLLEEAETLVHRGAVYAAFKRLASVIFWSEIQRGEAQLHQDWSELLERFLGSTPLSSITEGVQSDYEKLYRILSASGRYDSDELLLVITLRIQLEELAYCLREHLHVLVSCDLGLIDKAIAGVRSSASNSKKFNNEMRRVVRNNPLIIDVSVFNALF